MKFFSRRFWGNALIALGIALFLAVAYDSISPLFPTDPGGGALTWVENLFKKSPEGQDDAQDSRRPPERRAPRAMPANAAAQGLLTLNVHNTKDNYHLWVWRVKPGKKTGEKVTVEIAHAAPGEEGGFYIIAFADRNGDGNPDREIARSEFLTSEEAGKYSSFSFNCPDRVIFVGCTWPGSKNTRVYRGSGGWPGSDPDFDDRFFHVVNGFETQSAGPAYTNLKVAFPD